MKCRGKRRRKRPSKSVQNHVWGNSWGYVFFFSSTFYLLPSQRKRPLIFFLHDRRGKSSETMLLLMFHFRMFAASFCVWQPSVWLSSGLGGAGRREFPPVGRRAHFRTTPSPPPSPPRLPLPVLLLAFLSLFSSSPSSPCSPPRLFLSRLSVSINPPLRFPHALSDLPSLPYPSTRRALDGSRLKTLCFLSRVG